MMAFGYRFVDGYPQQAQGKLAVDAVVAALPN
jgi:hypothetical protein